MPRPKGRRQKCAPPGKWGGCPGEEDVDFFPARSMDTPFRDDRCRVCRGVLPGPASRGQHGISPIGIGGDGDDKEDGGRDGASTRGDTADRCLPARSDGDGDLRLGLILGSGLPVRESRRRSSHPRRVHGGIDGEPYVSRSRGPHRNGRGGLRSVRDLLR